MNFADLAITSLETVSAYDINTGAFKFMLDEMQTTSIEQSEDKTDITGKQGRKLTSLKRNKALAISGTNGLLSAGLMEMQTGSAFVNKATEIMWSDYLIVSNKTATTNFTAVGTTGNEIAEIHVKDSHGVVTKVLTQGAAAAAGVFAYAPATKALTFHEGDVADGAEIVVNYKRKVMADVMEGMSDNYSGKCTLYIDAMAEDKCANVYRVQIYIPKADFSGNFSIEMGDNQAVHSFEAEALAGSCGAGGMLWSYTVFGANVKDAA